MPLVWEEKKIIHKKEWDSGLVSLTYDWAPDFVPGQFVMALHPDDQPIQHRLYSIASAPKQQLELFIVRVESGHLTPKMTQMNVGEHMLFANKIKGTFTLYGLPPKPQLWLISTGTGLAPYVSMLREGALWAKYNRVIVVHGTRFAKQLAYKQELEDMRQHYPLTYLPYVTRESHKQIPTGRLTTLLDNGTLEKDANTKISSSDSHVLICGNPDMVTEVSNQLQSKYMLSIHKRHSPGEITIEKYW